MIIHTSYPLTFDDHEREDPVLALTRNDDRIVPLILEKERLLMAHLRLHIEGKEHTAIHDDIIDRLGLVKTMLNACWIAPLN